MTNGTSLKERLLELHYGLLTDAEAAEWYRRIESDAEVATEWDEVQRRAGLISQATHLQGIGDETMRTKFVPPVNETEQKVVPRKEEKPIASHRSNQTQRTKRRVWTLVTAASLVVLVIGFNLWRLFQELPIAAPIALRLEVFSEPVEKGQSPNQFAVRASQFRGGMKTANISFAVRTTAGLLMEEKQRTVASDKTLQFSVPATFTIPNGSWLEVTASLPDSKRFAPVTTKVPLEPTRCLTYLTTDKPIYRPGETVYYRSLTLKRQSLDSDLDVAIHFELVDPSGATVPGSTQEGVTHRGVGSGAYRIPSSLTGGQYTLIARSLDGFFPEEQLTVIVRQYRVPRFKTDIEFRRDSYGPGDTVEADFAVSRVEGGPLADAKLFLEASVDGEVVLNDQATTSDQGTHLISFGLPQHISEGKGQLSIIIDDGGTRETLVKSIPIQLGKVLVDFYPEGGDLVADLDNRVYFAARNTLGKPVHIAGEVLDEDGRKVANVKTVRDGLGRFQFRPKAGRQYTLKITEPLDVTNHPELPRAPAYFRKHEGIVLNTGTGVFAADEGLRFSLRSTVEMPVLVTAHCRGIKVGQDEFVVTDKMKTFVLPLDDVAGGVIRLTVSDARPHITTVTVYGDERDYLPRPIAERLVFRRHNRELNVQVVEKVERSPGEPARLTLQVTNEQGDPAAAVLGVAVVDDGALSLADEKRPSLRTHYLLTSEIRDPKDLEDADFYLDDKPDSAESLDLLLGTQGWRRFVERDLTVALGNEDFRAQIQRLLDLGTVSQPPTNIDNASQISAQIKTRNQIIRRHFGEFTFFSMLVSLPVVAVWLLTIFVRRLPLDTSGQMFVLATLFSASVSIAGCGVQNSRSYNDLESASSDAVATLESMDNDDLVFSRHAKQAVAATAVSNSKLAPMESNPAVETPQPDPVVVPPGDNEFVINVPPDITGGDLGMSASSRELTPEQLRQLLRDRGIDADDLSRKLLEELRFPVRQYAHRHVRSDSQTREDFAETVYWNPLIITDASGQATIRFDLSDSVTTFRVLADAHSRGRIGSGGGELVSRLPFQLEPKLPLEVTVGDRIDLPVAVVNNSRDALPVELAVTADGALRSLNKTERKFDVASDSRKREHFGWQVESADAGSAAIEVRGSAGTLSDAVRRTVQIAASGYPVRQSYSGVIAETERLRITVPESAVADSLKVTLRAFPSPLADLVEGLESILREPHGCFEQATSSNYPNTMTLRYLQDNNLAEPTITRRAKGMLDRGYKRLTSYECSKLGYEWFGQDPGHEALTAFGLMQFKDMAAVFTVEEQMISRTVSWLTSRRDGKGGFQRNPRHLHTWSVSQEVVNAYIVWALTEAGHMDLKVELDNVARVAGNSNDPYLIALSAASLLNADRRNEGQLLLDKLAELQAEDGHLEGKTTVTQSGGLSMRVETTALAALAWMKDLQYRDRANRAVTWIIRNRHGSGFGSTQATVLALKALVAHAKHSSRASNGGTLTVLYQGEFLAKASLPAGQSGTVEMTDLADRIVPGEIELELQAPGYGNLPYTLEVAYHSPTPPSNPECPMRLSTQLDETTIEAGETVNLTAEVINTTDQGQPMTVAIIGLPAGLEPRTEHLNELRKRGDIDYYELRPREIIFYWRSVAPNAKLSCQLPLVAEIPGQYTAPASRTYLYYTAEQKSWTEPLRVEISAE